MNEKLKNYLKDSINSNDLIESLKIKNIFLQQTLKIFKVRNKSLDIIFL